MTSDFSDQYRIINGRRLVLSAREADIRQWEELGFDKAQASGRAYYVIENEHCQVVLTDDPKAQPILRICVPLKSKQ